MKLQLQCFSSVPTNCLIFSAGLIILDKEWQILLRNPKLKHTMQWVAEKCLDTSKIFENDTSWNSLNMAQKT